MADVIIAVRPGQQLVGDPNGLARIVSTTTGSISPPFKAQSVLARGYWRDPTPEELAPRGAATVVSWDETLHPRAERGRFAKKPTPEPELDYHDAAAEPTTPNATGAGETEVRRALTDWHQRSLTQGWRSVTFQNADLSGPVTIDRSGPDPDASIFSETDRASDYKMSIAHELGDRMLAEGVTRDQLERYAQDEMGGIGRSLKDDVDIGPAVSPDSGFVSLGIMGDTAAGQVNPSKDDPQYDHLLAEAVASALVGNWASSANDYSPRALAMQDAAERVFGLGENVASWSSLTEGSQLGRDVDFITEHHGDLYESFLRAQYGATQDMLESAGIDNVELWRGVKFGETEDQSSTLYQSVMSSVDEGTYDGTLENQLTELRPMSSFAFTEMSASAFATGSGGGYEPGEAGGALLSATVPAERVLGTCASGFGCLGEDEVVVLGGGDTRFDVEWTTDVEAAGIESATEALNQEFDAEGADGQAVLNAYGPLVVEPDEYGMPGEVNAYLTHPVTGEQIGIDGIGAVDPLVQMLDLDPVGTATRTLTDGITPELMPRGWTAELAPMSSFEPTAALEVQLHGPNGETNARLSPLEVLGEDLNTFDSGSITRAVAEAEATQVGLNLQSAVHSELNQGIPVGPDTTPVFLNSGEGPDFAMSSVYKDAPPSFRPIGEALSAGPDPNLIVDVLAEHDPAGVLQVRTYSPDAPRPTVVAEIPMADLYAGGTPATVEFAQNAADTVAAGVAP